MKYPVTLLMCFVLVCTTTSGLQNDNGKTNLNMRTSSTAPHIVLAVADDLGYNDVSWRNKDIISPHLAELAESGLILGDYHVYKVCSPTRASLMTGRYPNRAGLHDFIAHNAPIAINANYTFLPQALKQAGYATHMVGKWHLGYWDWKYIPTGRGFDSFLGYMGGSEDYYTHTHTGCGKKPRGPGYPDLDLSQTYPNNTLISQPQYRNVYALDFFVPHIEAILAAHPVSTPLFFYMPFQNVHEPLQVPANYSNLYSNLTSTLPHDRITLMGMVTALDDAINAVVTSLKAHNMWQHTLFIFSTDNGGNTKAAGNNWPLRGGKFTFWEGGNRGTAFIHAESEYLLPSSLRGKVYPHLMHVADWFATLCEAANTNNISTSTTTPASAIDSISQWTALRTPGSVAPRSEIIHEVTLDKHGKISVGKIRSGNWNLYVGFPGTPNGWVHANNTITRGPQDCSQDACLFDMSVDVDERSDVAHANSDVVKQLKARLKAAAVCPDDMCTTDVYNGKNSCCEAFDKYGSYGPWAAL